MSDRHHLRHEQMSDGHHIRRLVTQCATMTAVDWDNTASVSQLLLPPVIVAAGYRAVVSQACV